MPHKKLSETELKEIVFDNFNDLVRTIQDKIGIESGDSAAHFFDEDKHLKFMQDWMKRYIQFEKDIL